MDTPKHDLETFAKPIAKRWQPSKETEEEALLALTGILPVKLRRFCTDDALLQLYQQGNDLYKAGRYKEALTIFQLLSIANAKESRFVQAVGSCLHMMKDYFNAGQSYNAASFLDPEDPMPLYYLSDCMVKMNNKIGAYIVLEMALTRCQKNPRYKALQNRIEMLVQSMEKEFEEKKKAGVTFFRTGDPKNPTLYLAEDYMKRFKEKK